MSLSVFFTVFLAICAIDTVVVLIWLLKGFTSWRLEPNSRRKAGLVIAGALVGLQWVGLVFVTDQAYWKPRALEASKLAYSALRPIDETSSDAKSMRRMHEYMLPCVSEMFAADQTRLDAGILWGEPQATTLKTVLQADIGALEGICWMSLEPQIKLVAPDGGPTSGLTQRFWTRWRAEQGDHDKLKAAEVMLLELFFELKAANALPGHQKNEAQKQDNTPLMLRKPEVKQTDQSSETAEG